MLPLSPFIGRENDLASIQDLLTKPACRLLTLVGPGGIGKTHLALQLGKMNEAQFEHGVAVTPLHPLSSAEFFMPALANALGISLTRQEPLSEQISYYLRNKEILIIFDNFEHIMDAADQLLLLLRSTPHIKYLVTSHEPLNLQEEWLYPLSGMAYPVGTENQATFQSFDAIQLFSERAQRANPNFSLEEEAKDIMQICQLVDGMPLALELAAAWRKSLSSKEIVTEIQHDLGFLTTHLRDVPERHRSIQVIFEQTWQKLTQPEKDVFQRLSVFRGGFYREAAADITDASLPILSALVDRSLLRMDVDGRYHLHELLRQYANEQLAKDKHEWQETHTKQARYYMTYLQVQQEDIWAQQQLKALKEIRKELDNIRAAWMWAVEHIDTDSFITAGDTLGAFYQFTGNYLEGMSLFSQAADALQAQEQREDVDLALLRILSFQSWFHLRFGNLKETEAGMRHCQSIYERLQISPLPGFLSDPAIGLSFVALIRSDYEIAWKHAEQVRGVATAQQHLLNALFAYQLLSEVHRDWGEYEIAQQLAQKAYATAQTIGDRWFTADILNNLGRIAMLMNDLATARTYFRASYEIRQEFDDPGGMALAASNLGNIALKEDSPDEAEGHFQHSYAIYQEINDKGGQASTSMGLGTVALEQGQYKVARAQFHRALELGLEINFRSLLLALLIKIARLLWELGQQEQSLRLLTFIAKYPATDQENKGRASHQLEIYKVAVTPAKFAEATQEDFTDDLKASAQNCFMN